MADETDSAVRDAAEKIRKAVQDPGPHPTYHHKIMRAQRKEWPTLWAAIDELLAALARLATPPINGRPEWSRTTWAIFYERDVGEHLVAAKADRTACDRSIGPLWPRARTFYPTEQVLIGDLPRDTCAECVRRIRANFGAADTKPADGYDETVLRDGSVLRRAPATPDASGLGFYDEIGKDDAKRKLEP